jgi:CubicO group peptidase (beta-lactamase class C family)
MSFSGVAPKMRPATSSRSRVSKRTAWLLRLVLAVSIGVTAASGHAASQTSSVWPTRSWATSSPEELGIASDELEALDREFASGDHGYVDGMLVIRHGRIAFERAYSHDYDRLFVGKGAPHIYNYYDPAWHPFYNRTALHTMQSVTKSVTSILIGIAIARGEIPGVDTLVMPYFSAFKVTPDPRRDRMRLRDVLNMRTGIKWNENSSYTDPMNSCTAMEATDDWVQYVLDQPMMSEPGTAFVYNSGGTQLLSYILKKATGKEADDYAKEHLFSPLGIENYYWKRTPKGLADTEGGLYLLPRDLAKIGYLYLNGGVWDGRQIVPGDWITQSTQRQMNAGHSFYGFQWWLLPHRRSGAYDAYAAWGYGGQSLIVVPEFDLIVVFTGWNIYGQSEVDPRIMYLRMIAAVKEGNNTAP